MAFYNIPSSSDFSTLMLFRCCKREWAEQFQHGEIYFGSPQQWIDLEKSGRKGQGDILEGIFFSTETNDHSEHISNWVEDSSLEHFSHKNLTYFRRKSILNLRCLCLYGLHDNAFSKVISDDGRAHYKTSIPKNYFFSFTEYKTREEYDKIDTKEQPVIILINDPQKFINRICKFLASLDVKEDEIIISPVRYLDLQKPIFLMGDPPQELLIKDLSFMDQSEIRIIINSTTPKYLDYMQDHGNKISIGSLNDIAEIYDFYFDEMQIERLGNKKLLFSLPKSIQRNLNEMTFFELEDLLYNILGGTVNLINLPPNCNTWNKKLKPLADLFLEKYGVVLHVDEDKKKIFFFNMSQNLLDQSNEKHKDDMLRNQFEKTIEELLLEEKYDKALTECLANCHDKLLGGTSFFCLGKIYCSQSRFQEAIDAYKKSIENDYKRTDALNAIATIHFNQGEYDQAIRIYYSIQDETGYDTKILCNIGVCYLRLMQYEKAKDFFTEAIELDENDGLPYYYKGVALYMIKNYSQAKYYMEKAIILSPENELYKNEYKRCFEH